MLASTVCNRIPNCGTCHIYLVAAMVCRLTGLSMHCNLFGKVQFFTLKLHAKQSDYMAERYTKNKQDDGHGIACTSDAIHT